MFFFQRNWLPFFISRSSYCSVINIKVEIKILVERKTHRGLGFVAVFFLFLKVRVAMQFTTETREYLTREILTLSYMKGWTYVRTIFSEIKFLGCIDNKMFLPMVLRFVHLRRESEADNNNIFNNGNNNSNYSNNNNNINNNK